MRLPDHGPSPRLRDAALPHVPPPRSDNRPRPRLPRRRRPRGDQRRRGHATLHPLAHGCSLDRRNGAQGKGGGLTSIPPAAASARSAPSTLVSPVNGLLPKIHGSVPFLVSVGWAGGKRERRFDYSYRPRLTDPLKRSFALPTPIIVPARLVFRHKLASRNQLVHLLPYALTAPLASGHLHAARGAPTGPHTTTHHPGVVGIRGRLDFSRFDPSPGKAPL
eukprot:scaffold22030_cov66-Phaeocystis_antarctica.AAC.8